MASWCWICNRKVSQDYIWFKGRKAHKKCVRNKMKIHNGRSDINPNLIKIAELLHSIQCHWNHTDYCGWYYEDWDSKIGYARTRYLEQAKKLVHEHHNEEKLIEILETILETR